jgi:hypothetical protein
VFLRALEPVTAMRVQVTGGPAGDVVTARTGGSSQQVTVDPAGQGAVTLAPGAPFVYKDSFVYVVRFRSERAGMDTAGRSLGSFVRIELDVARRARPRP